MRALAWVAFGLLAAPLPAAVAGCQPDADAAVSALAALRAQARACGERAWPAAPPLRWHALLEGAARRHAEDLAVRDRLEHVSAVGATLRTRLREAGYVMRLSAENLAGGPETLEEVLAQWLASPAHCDNLMGAEFEDFGLACVGGPGRLQRYWVLQVGAPLRSSPGR